MLRRRKKKKMRRRRRRFSHQINRASNIATQTEITRKAIRTTRKDRNQEENEDIPTINLVMETKARKSRKMGTKRRKENRTGRLGKKEKKIRGLQRNAN